MKQIWSLLCLLFLTHGLHADQVPATASEAMNNHATTVKKFVDTNQRELKHAAIIAGNLAKIGGAIALSVFTVKTGKYFRRASRISRSFLQKYDVNLVFKDWWSPVMVVPTDKDGNDWTYIEIPRPPYFIAFPISAYLLYDGSHGMYKEIQAILKERNTPKQATKAEPVVTIKQETTAVPTIESQPVILVTPPVAQAIEPVAPQITNEPVATKSIDIESTESTEDSVPPLEPIPTSESENGQ